MADGSQQSLQIMETKTRFDINAAVFRWRQTLENSPALGSRDLDELETHLRDSVQRLVRSGLDPREAFLVAVRRLGANHDLEAEFAKVNVRQVWFERGVWILCGLLGANVLSSATSVFPNSILNVALWRGINPYIAGALALVTGWLAWGAFVAIAFFVLTHLYQPLSRIAQASLKYPVWTGIALVLALEGMQLFPSYAMRSLEPLWQVIAPPNPRVSQESSAIIQSWFMWTGIAAQFFWIISVPLLAGYVWRRNPQGGLPNPAKTAVDLKPTERQAADGLQARGLSFSEALLLIAARRNATAVLPWEYERPPQRLWLERGFWLLVGLVIERVLLPFLLQPSTMLLAGTRGASSLLQHLAGIGSLCLCLGVIAGMVVVVSKALTRYQPQVKWLGNLCCERPALASVFFAALALVTGVSLYFLERMILPNHPGISGLGSSWLRYCSIITYLVAPVILLLWFARNRPTDAPAV